MPAMDFLALVKSSYREGGFVGDGPVTVLNQVGRKADVVSWVQQAFEEIQGARTDWNFDWASADCPLIIGKDTYDPETELIVPNGVRDFGRAPQSAYVYPNAQGVQGRSFLTFREWVDFRGMNTPPANGSVPIIYTLRPDGKVVYWPIPTVACTAVHEYMRPLQTLVEDDDTPRMPSRYHMVIVWKAVMIACGKTKDFSRFDTAEENYYKLYERMLIEQTPRMVIGGSALA